MQQHTLFGEPVARVKGKTDAQRLREALAPYLDLRGLQVLASTGGDIRAALINREGDTPQEVSTLLEAVAAVMTPKQRVQIKQPQALAALLMAEMSVLDQEQLRVVLLNTQNRIMKIVILYQGTIDSACCRPAEVFKEAIRMNATSIIVAHNHPSGQVTASREDVEFTKNIVAMGNALEIAVLDHLIIGEGQYASLRELKLGFPNG